MRTGELPREGVRVVYSNVRVYVLACVFACEKLFLHGACVLCACVRACVCACVRACVRAYVRGCVCAHVFKFEY